MRALVQRVKSARVRVAGEIIGEIGPGILTLLGISVHDEEAQVDWIIQKIAKLRIFEDAEGKMNRSLLDVKGAHLIVSQFTLYGDPSQGNRPSYIEAARPEKAEPLYRRAIEASRALGIPTESGKFQAEMEVELVNEGPVTLMIESPRK